MGANICRADVRYTNLCEEVAVLDSWFDGCSTKKSALSSASTPDLTKQIIAARHHVKLAWSIQSGSFTRPSEPHPHAEALIKYHNANYTPLQLDQNVLELLATFWEVPVVEGTSRDTRAGFVDPAIRAQLTELVGAPPFRLIGWKQLQKLGYIPRSSENQTQTLHDILANKCASGLPVLDPKGNPIMQIYMVSHTWPRKADQLDGNDEPDESHPDFEHGAKVKALISFGQYTQKTFGREVFYWIDYCCINQDNLMPGIRSLPLYVCSCSSFLVLHSEGYDTRAWTRLEQCLFMAIGTKPAITAISVDGTFFPDMSVDKDGMHTRKPLFNPIDGAISDESDKAVIHHLTTVSQDNWATGWVEPPGYWSGEDSTRSSTNVIKYGPGLKSVRSLAFGATQVLVRRMEMTPEGPRVMHSHSSGCITFADK